MNKKNIRPALLLAAVLGVSLSGCSVLPDSAAPKPKEVKTDVMLEEVVIISDNPYQPTGGYIISPAGGGGSGGGGGNGSDGGGYGGGSSSGGAGSPASVSGTNFRMALADQAKYPRLTNMIKNLESFANSDANVSAALAQYTHLTPAQISQHLKGL